MKHSGFNHNFWNVPSQYSFLPYMGNSHNLEGILCSYYNKVVSILNGCFNSKAIWVWVDLHHKSITSFIKSLSGP